MKPITGLISVLVVIAMCGVCGLGALGDDDDKAPARATASPSPSVSRQTNKADDSAVSACRELAMRSPYALTVSARKDLAVQVAMWSKDSATADIRGAGTHLVRTTTTSRKAWKTSASRFLALCRKRGWKGLSEDDRKLGRMLADIEKSDGSSSGYGNGSSGDWGGSRRRGGKFW
jgi:hypothetical protein